MTQFTVFRGHLAYIVVLPAARHCLGAVCLPHENKLHR